MPGAVDPNAHDYSEWTEIPANVNTAGMKGHYHCSLCDKYFDADYAAFYFEGTGERGEAFREKTYFKAFQDPRISR